MTLRFRKHSQGPTLPDTAKTKQFRSYVDMANWADQNLPHGRYYAYNDKGSNLLTMLREVDHEVGRFYVEGRGNI